MRRDKQIVGFDYRLGREVVQPLGTWKAETKVVEERGGFTKRIAGDLIVFNDKSKMLFEVYDKDEKAAA